MRGLGPASAPLPSPKHQSLIRLVTEGPGVLQAVLAVVGIEIPDDIEILPGPDAVRDGGSADFFADGVLATTGDDSSNDRRAWALEVQLGKDHDKPYRWPMYTVVSRNRLECAVDLVVITDSIDVARWAKTPITVGSGMVMRPIVVGPEELPVHVSLETALRVPALAVLAVVGHGGGPEARGVGRRAIEAIRPMLDRDPRVSLYLDVLFVYLDEGVLAELLEEEMQRLEQPISKIFLYHRTEGIRQGRTEGMVAMLERLLEQRGLEPSVEQHARMASCRDPYVLRAWFDRALTASSVAEVFDDQPSHA